LNIKKIGNFFPALLVASTPFAGWSLFNVGSSFAFTASYVVNLFAILFWMFIPRSAGSYYQTLRYRQFIAIPLISICLISFLPLLFWDYSNINQFILSYLHLLFWILTTDILLQIPSKVEQSIQFFLKTYLSVCLGVVFFGFYDLYLLITTGSGFAVSFNVRVRDFPAINTFMMLPRASSIFFEPGWYAHYVLICLILVISWMIPDAAAQNKKAKKLFLTVVAIVFLLSILSTLSASAIAISFATLIYYLLSKPKPFQKIFFLVLLFLIFYFFPMPGDLPNPIGVLFERFYGLLTGDWIPGESADSRAAEIQGAFALFLNSNMLGIGLGQSTFYLTEIEPVGTLGISSFYALLLAETGVLGFSVFIFSLIALNVYLLVIQRRIKFKSPLWDLILGIRCLLFAECLFLNFFSNFSSPTYMTSFWLIFAALFVLKNKYGIQSNVLVANQRGISVA
jgi:hypothetical protein